MLNKIWFWLFVIGVAVALGKGVYRTVWPDAAPAVAGSQRADAGGRPAAAGSVRIAALRDAGRQLTQASFDAARAAVDLCLGMFAGFARFLGVIRIAQDAGLVQVLANAMRPLIRWLFPDIPDGHPAAGAILMSFAANILGLDNAATPFGLKAMKELQTLNPLPDTATNAMAMFLAVNASSICLIPTGIIALRLSAQSAAPAAPIVQMLMATTMNAISAVIAVRLLQRRYPLEVPRSLAGKD